jgi:pyruvate dehydrogenase E1 component alpha subunit
MRGNDNVVLSFFGDGAANEGAFHEAVNLAAIWRLPVVFVCENNQYGMSFSTARAFAIDHISERAAGYGIPGVTVDGNDVEVVHATVAEAVARARRGDGPTLVEAETYRWKGHSKSDKNAYRTKDEIAEWRARDPIVRFENAVTERGVLDESATARIRDEAQEAVRDAVRQAMTAPDATPDDLLAGVYAEVSA